jgi:hypothetical protein
MTIFILLLSLYAEKEPSSYAEVSLEETPLTVTTNKSLSSGGRRSTGSIHSVHQIVPIKFDDTNTPNSFT